MIPLVVVAGPTGSGKSGLALALAERLGTEILSADSMQCYRGMEIGTAAPSQEELARVPHHFMAFLGLDQRMDASDYGQRARAEVARLNAAGKTAVAAGGSGLYINALVDGIFAGPGRQEAVRQRLHAEAAEHGNARLMARLREVDPAYAATLSSENDLIRIVRALEVHEASGQTFSALHAAHQAQAEPIAALQVALDWDREQLYARINARVEQMVAAGWVEEVRRLIAAGHEAQLHRIKALGYREMLAHLHGQQTLEEAVAATQQHHRRYAKRQLGWFRADKRIHWLPVTPDTPTEALAARVEALMRAQDTKAT